MLKWIDRKGAIVFCKKELKKHNNVEKAIWNMAKDECFCINFIQMTMKQKYKLIADILK